MQKRFVPFAVFLILFFSIVIGALAHAHIAATPAIALAESEKKVYLTFDDGPSTLVTGRILDTLEEEGVKATFFIVSDRAKTRKTVLKRIAEEEHTLGVHSATHDYEKIYASDEALLKDISECSEYIYAVTGVRPAVYRFPGGGLCDKERRKALVENAGYRVVSWNAVCGDEEIWKASADTLYNKTVETSKGKRSVVLLMHDSAPHKETAEALPRIIAYYRQEGYTFCTF